MGGYNLSYRIGPEAENVVYTPHSLLTGDRKILSEPKLDLSPLMVAGLVEDERPHPLVSDPDGKYDNSRVPMQAVYSYRSGASYDPDLDPIFMATTRSAQFQELSWAADRSMSDYDTGHLFSKRSLCVDYPAPVSIERGRVFSHAPRVPNHFFWQNANPFPCGSGIYQITGDPRPPAATRKVIEAYGTEAISATRPNKPAASVSQFIGEVAKDGFPALTGMALAFANGGLSKRAASEYLNVQFGIKPFISDLKSFYKTVKNFNRIITQYERDQGRLVRRQHFMQKPIENSTSSEKRPDARYGAPNSSFYQRNHENFYCIATGSKQCTRTESFSFSGGFMYYIPQDEGIISELIQIERKLDRLLGTKITIEVLWNVAPWSWLIDWFTNIGPLLGNYEAFQDDKLVLKYAYATRKASHTHVAHWGWDPRSYLQVTNTNEFSLTVQLIETARERATPYGFGFDLGSLSEYQWSILGALGLTLGPGALRST